jgi:hypothetical protein
MNNRMNVWTAVVVLVTVLCAGGLPARADLVSNGSFEAPVTTGSFVETPPDGWTLSAGQVVVVDQGWRDPGDITAANGSQWLALQGRGSEGGAISQTLATTPGATYTLSFAHAALSNGGELSHLTYTVDGVANTLTVNSAGTAAVKLTPWQNVSYQFTASGTATVLSFAGDQPVDGLFYGSALDHVSVNPVPEPGTITLVATGTIGLLAYAWRRRRV